ncbi:hypothetical protein BH24DEI2_BH24DEI2_05440 [soil metagenome]
MDVQADMNLQTDAAYTFTFQPETSGARTLTVEAYDGNGASAASSVNVEVTESQPSVDTFAVTVTVLGDGRVSSTPEGLACPGTCTHSFERGTAVSLAADAAADARFAGWSDGCAGTSCTVSAEAQVTATFESDERREAASVPFTIVALPDTQNYLCYGADGDGCGGKSERFPQLFEAQTQWIADNVSAQDIAFVTHEGDMVDNALNEAEWLDGDRAVDKLDGKVPYSVAIGDHDYGPEEYRDGDTTFYRAYFGAARYENYDWYGGTSPSGLSHYQLFSAGGYDFLHIALEWEAPTSAKTWAKAVLAAHPDLPTIITTHAYLRDGDTSGRSTFTQSCFQPGNPAGSKKCPGSKEGTKDGDASSGQDIFDELVNPYPQVFMVLNGHFHYNGRRESSCTGGYSACDNGEYRQVSLNKAGSKVYEMLANYQDYANGGDGWLRLLRFVPGGGEGGLDRIEVKTYSPVLDSYQSGDASDFAFDLSFAERFGPQP